MGVDHRHEQAPEQHRVGEVRANPNRERVELLDRGQRGEDSAAACSGRRVVVVVEGRDHVVGGERLPVRECHSLAQLEVHGERIDLLPRGGEPGLHLTFFIDVDQRVVERGDRRERLGIEGVEHRQTGRLDRVEPKNDRRTMRHERPSRCWGHRPKSSSLNPSVGRASQCCIGPLLPNRP